MGSLITHGGMIMAAVAVVLMVATYHTGVRFTVWDRHLLVAGVVFFLLGLVFRRRHQDRGWRVRGDRCAVCGTKVHTGQIYCDEHHKQATRRAREKHDRERY